MTSLSSSAGSAPWIHQANAAATHRMCAGLFPPPMSVLRTTSNPTLFPFPVYSLTSAALCHRRAWTINSLQKTGKELSNTATVSLMNHPFLSRLPWRPPLCCFLQPEAARRSRARVNFPVVDDTLPSQPQQRATARRDSPVNWLLSDDVKVTSSENRDRMWNSPVDRRPESGSVRERDDERRPASRSHVTGSTSCSDSGLVTNRKLTCRHCGKPYASLGALKMHIRTHTLPCRCQLCGKAFSRPWLLQGHMRTHTGERPFACPQCGRAFADRSNLRAHLQTHAELKKYACDRCTKTFSRLSLLVKHRNGPAVCGAASSSSWRP